MNVMSTSYTHGEQQSSITINNTWVCEASIYNPVCRCYGYIHYNIRYRASDYLFICCLPELSNIISQSETFHNIVLDAAKYIKDHNNVGLHTRQSISFFGASIKN